MTGASATINFFHFIYSNQGVKSKVQTLPIDSESNLRNLIFNFNKKSDVCIPYCVPTCPHFRDCRLKTECISENRIPIPSEKNLCSRRKILFREYVRVDLCRSLLLSVTGIWLNLPQRYRCPRKHMFPIFPRLFHRNE